MAVETVPIGESFDFEDEGHRIDGLLAIASWVESARELLSIIRLNAQLDPKFQAELAEKGIPWNEAAWEDPESAGLRRLLMETTIACRRVQAAGMTLGRTPRAQLAAAARP